MSVGRVYNPDTGEWEFLFFGGTGPTGPTGPTG